MGDKELKDLEDSFDVNSEDDMADFMSMLDSIDVDDAKVVDDLEKSDTLGMEEELEGLADADFSEMSDDEENADKKPDMMSELGLDNLMGFDEPEINDAAFDDMSSFVTEEDADILNLLDSVGEESVQLPDMDDNMSEEMADESVGELVDFLADFPDGASMADISDKEQEKAEEKMAFFQRIAAFFHKEPSEEERIALEQEEEEERAWEEKKSAEAEVKRQEKQKKKEEKAAEAEVKKQQRAEEAEKKKQAKEAAKAAKREEKQASKGPVPKSQLVPVKPLVAMIAVGVAFSVAFVMFSNYRFYSSSISESKEQFIHRKYRAAYEKLVGLDIKKKDANYFEQAKTMRIVDKDWEAYNNYIEGEDYEEALDSLIKGIGKYNIQSERAQELKLEKEMRDLYEQMLKELTVRFSLTAQDASNLYEMKDRKEYEKQVQQFARDAALKDGVLEEVEITNETE